MFVRGADGTLLVSELSERRASRRGSRSAATWTRAPAPPAARAQNTDVFVRGGDGALYQQSFMRRRAAGPAGIRLGHSMLSAPAVSVRRGSGILDLFWRGADNGIEAKSWVPGQGWTDVNNTQLDPGADRSRRRRPSRATAG